MSWSMIYSTRKWRTRSRRESVEIPHHLRKNGDGIQRIRARSARLYRRRLHFRGNSRPRPDSSGRLPGVLQSASRGVGTRQTESLRHHGGWEVIFSWSLWTGLDGKDDGKGRKN